MKKSGPTRRSTLRATSGATVNADVGPGNILAAARTMDPPQLRNEGHARRGNDFGPGPITAMKNEANKAFHHYGAQGAPKVNADVGSKRI